MRQWRAKNKLRAIYSTLRWNAKRRNRTFTITFKYFCKIVSKCPNFLTNRGREKFSVQVDRINNSKGYIKGNIQILTLAENRKKQTEEYRNNSCPF